MKRICVAGYITGRYQELLLGRRGKHPNSGMLVLPGGGVEEGETLEQALTREVLEETGYEISLKPGTFNRPSYLVELDDRIIIVAKGQAVNYEYRPKEAGDLYEVGWHAIRDLPWKEISLVVAPVIRAVWEQEELEKRIPADPYDTKGVISWW